MRDARAVFVAIAVVAHAVAAAGSTVSLPASGDTYLRSGAVNANQNGDAFLRVNSSPNRALVRFDQPAIASAATGMVLLSATLELFAETANSWSTGRAIDVHRLTADWTESGA